MLKQVLRVLGDSNERVIKQMGPIVDEINGMESEYEGMSEDELRALTADFRARQEDGEELDDILPEAFAAVREAAKRTLGQRHFDVQLMGGVALHEGKIAEMRTGEGKTLVATLAAYLNAIAGEGVHVVTVNDYLARRDAQWMGAIYRYLGLSVGVLQHNAGYLYDPSVPSEDGFGSMAPVTRREAYSADITYGTNNEFGFDYLRDNMVVELAQRVQRQRKYAIVDEVDNILIDEARTPLIISGPAEESAKEYQRFARLAPTLQPVQDYTIDEKHRSVSLTGEGMSKMERALNVQNLYSAENFGLVHFLENALKARATFERDKEYVVVDGEVVIVDEFTGRLMPGRRYSDGLHQALEAKEGLRVQRESITYATITLQNYFRLYDKLAGMTGTAATEAEEFFKIYKLEVVTIPTHENMVREDATDFVYQDEKAKFNAVVEDIDRRHRAGQPVLVGTVDIDKSEVLSEMLDRKKVPHEVLNAKHHEREAAIVTQAGRPGAVTVATNMAGRGTDIILGGNMTGLDISQEEWEEDHRRVVKAGGLYVIGTERHEARRIDNQLRGRSGRQGDPGSTRFYVGLDDDLMRRFGGDRIKSIMSMVGLEEDVAIENRMVTKSIEGAQVKVEAYHFDMRKHLVDYDDVVNTHRDVVYGEREKVIQEADLKANITAMVQKEVQEVLDSYLAGIPPETWDLESLTGELSAIFPLPGNIADLDGLGQLDPEEINELVLGYAAQLYEDREQELTPEVMRSVERQVMLRVIDSHWVQHLTAMEQLRQGIGLQAFGQRDPLVMYKKEGHQLFQNLLAHIQHDIVYTMYHIAPAQNGSQPGQRPKAISRKESVMTKVVGDRGKEPVAAGSRKVGRNDPCPCGSGKKYKRCHGG